jgi:hypothetical protein
MCFAFCDCVDKTGLPIHRQVEHVCAVVTLDSLEIAAMVNILTPEQAASLGVLLDQYLPAGLRRRYRTVP